MRTSCRPWCRTNPACWPTSPACSPRAASTSTAWPSARPRTPDLSRMTFVVHGDDAELEQVRKQLDKIVTVVKVQDISSEDFVERDLMLIKVKADAAAAHRDRAAGRDVPRPGRGHQPRTA